MTKKATNKTCFILLFLFILLTGCSTKKASESAVSPEAEAVLNAMFTAPNDDLYSLDSSTVIGENNTADSENASVNSEKILENWNKLVGKYFETGRLEYFISTYGQTYLSEAAYNNTKITHCIKIHNNHLCPLQIRPSSPPQPLTFKGVNRHQPLTK